MAKTNYSISLQEDSKNFITEATLQLLASKSFNKLTVMEVVKRAGVSRMAFYRNFESIEDVLKQYYCPKFEAFFDKIKKTHGEEELVILTEFFSAMKSDLIKAINHDYDSIFFDILSQQTELFIQPQNRSEYYQMKFIIAGTFTVWKVWLTEEDETSLAEMWALLSNLTKKY
ncbi:TetR/AcrR family transcriptional regulator [Enterococcus malodoratus]|uniref:TetR/AcrR family transcriptional regulator n=1 Tax=Enterococcus malodoratus TaxID=71451 RepID=UPI0039AEBF57